jgi:peptidoglycan hydrolase-like protein with peptidoglycan-binding domain
MCLVAPSLAAEELPHFFSNLDGCDGSYAATPDGAGGWIAVGGQDRADPAHKAALMRREDSGGSTIFERHVMARGAERAVVYDVLRLPDGDHVAAVWARPQGAAADDCFVLRFRADGSEAWQAFQGGDDHERCYFAQQLPSGRLIVGGRYERLGSPCQGPVQAAVREVDKTSGTATGAPRYAQAAGALRSAFQSAVTVLDGSTTFVSWATDQARGDNDARAVRIASDGRRASDRRWGATGNYIAYRVVARPSGGVIPFGSAMLIEDEPTRGLAAAIDGDRRQVWLRTFQDDDGGDDRFYGGAIGRDIGILAVGTSSASTISPRHGWRVELDPGGDLRKGRVVSLLTSGSQYVARWLRDGELRVVGTVRPSGRGEDDAWVVRLSGRVPAAVSDHASIPLPAKFATQDRSDLGQDLGRLNVTRPTVTAGQLNPSEIRLFTFTLAKGERVEITLIPSDRDADLVVVPSKGVPVGSWGGNQAAELVVVDLAAGQHAIQVVGGANPTGFRLSVRIGSQLRPTPEVLALEASWDDEVRRLTERGLELLGYDTGMVDGIFTAATRKAIAAFQASLNAAPIGWLSDRERLMLAVAAAEVAAELADAAAARAVAAAAGPFAAVAEADEGFTKGEFGGDMVHAVGKLSDGATYQGQWRQSNFTLQPDGFGARLEKDRELAGEFAKGELSGYGVLRVKGAVELTGEWRAQGTTSVPYGYVLQTLSSTPTGGFWTDAVTGKPERAIP